MTEPFHWFCKRRKVQNQPWPNTHWRGFLAGTVGIILMSFAVFDYPVGVMSGDLNEVIRHYGATVTEFGSSRWMLITAFLAFFVGLSAAGPANGRKLHLRAHGVFLAQGAAFLFASVALSGMAANILKKMIGRPRPSMIYQDIGPFEFHFLEFNSKFASFPSGHATTTAAFFTAVAFFCPRYRVLLISIAVCIAMSRAIVGAHYPSDVFAGLAFGAWFTYLIAIVFSRYRLVFMIDGHGWPVPRPAYRQLRLQKQPLDMHPYLDIFGQKRH